jgi:hypothetical protein
MRNIVLTREAFREKVFARDKNKCVFCGEPAADAHHILDRKLFGAPCEENGYFLNNGASVCNTCHLLCEDCTYTVEQVRTKCGIIEPVLPQGFSPACTYNKWGVEVATRYHYPRTYHFDWSLSLMNDDRRLETDKDLIGHRVIATEKYDGEGFSGYSDGSHARSLDSANHPSRDWAKRFHGQIKHNIPEKWRYCAENAYATHSIKYRRALGNALPSFLIGFSVWDEKNVCLSWDDTLVVFEALGITPVKVIYDGPYDEALLRKMALEQNDELVEGYVVRRADAFRFDQFATHVGKYVRARHVRTTNFWRTEEIVPNKMIEE